MEMEIIHLALRSEYSFKQTFGHMRDLVTGRTKAVGIADINSTFGHVKLEQYCNKAGLKPIFGVRLMVVEKPTVSEKHFGPEYIFIAKNNDGLVELYSLVNKAYDNFYYFPRVGLVDVWSLSEDVIVIAEDFKIPERIDYIGLSTATSKRVLDVDLPRVAINTNYYTNVEDKPVYELLSGNRGRSLHTYPQHILSDEEWYRIWGDDKAIENTHVIANQCGVILNKSEMVKYHGHLNLRKLCCEGAKKKNIDLTIGTEYGDRFEREMQLIIEKDYTDYFLIVADMIIKAKKKMLVGPSRGSSAGSLVCYLARITEVDPIKFGLIFERFIDINRLDLPDIDIDFPDNKRDLVIKELTKTYGKSKVKHIATVSTLKPKSAIGEFAMELCIPAYETEAVKDAIIERSGGDARSAMCILDTFESTEVGKEFIDKYPAMKIVEKIEGHAKHTGTHAAGIIVCNEDLVNYAGVNSRDDTIMMDKKDAEYEIKLWFGDEELHSYKTVHDVHLL